MVTTFTQFSKYCEQALGYSNLVYNFSTVSLVAFSYHYMFELNSVTSSVPITPSLPPGITLTVESVSFLFHRRQFMLLHYDHPTLYCGAVKTDTIVSQVLEVQMQVQVAHYQARVHVQVQTSNSTHKLTLKVELWTTSGYLRMQVSYS